MPDWIDNLIEDASRSRQHVNLSPDEVPPVPVAVRPPAPTAVPRHSVLVLSLLFLAMSGVILLAWWLSGVHLDF